MKNLKHISDQDLLKLHELMKSNKLKANDKRRADIIKHGYSTKFAYHIVRLFLEVEQIMATQDLILDNNVPILRSIREGEWTLEQIETWANDKEKHLENLYSTSSLQYEPDEGKIKSLLLEVIEMHYGSVSQSFVKDAGKEVLIREMQEVINKYLN